MRRGTRENVTAPCVCASLKCFSLCPHPFAAPPPAPPHSPSSPWHLSFSNTGGFVLWGACSKKKDFVASYLWPVHGSDDERRIQQPSAVNAGAQSSTSSENTPLGPLVEPEPGARRQRSPALRASISRAEDGLMSRSLIFFFFKSKSNTKSRLSHQPACLCCAGTNLAFFFTTSLTFKCCGKFSLRTLKTRERERKVL